MKTDKQWAARIQNSKEPWDKLVKEIQMDALEHAKDICVTRADSLSGIGAARGEALNCAEKIEESIEKLFKNET